MDQFENYDKLKGAAQCELQQVYMKKWRPRVLPNESGHFLVILSAAVTRKYIFVDGRKIFLTFIKFLFNFFVNYILFFTRNMVMFYLSFLMGA